MDLIFVAYILLAYWLYSYFARSDRGPKEPVGALRAACWFGVGAVIAAGVLNQLLVPKEVIEFVGAENPVTPPLATLVQGVMTISLIEETLKFVPLALFIYKKGYFNELTDGVVYFALAGIWFGSIESIGYASLYGGEVGLMRLIIAPFLHAGFTALAGIGLIRYKLVRRRWYVIAGWFALAVVLHALYNLSIFLSGGAILIALLIALAVNLGPFYFFKKAQRADELRGMSAVGVNKYCRNCGLPNPEGFLFCTRCGKKT
jgi:RsiW-degrading membrane proteinase PrsW (M82 family)